jgi:glucose dehydrogenase
MQSTSKRLASAGALFANSAVRHNRRKLDVEKLTADPNNWAMQAGDMFNQRYSKLTQINAQNVGKMQVAWMFSTGVLRGHEGSPLVVNGTMYLHTPFPNKVFALDIDTQKIKWRYEPKQDAAVIPQMCCDTVYRALRMRKTRSSCSRPIACLSHSMPTPARWSGRSRMGSQSGRSEYQRAPRFKDKVITGIRRGMGRARLYHGLRHQLRQAGLESV